MEIIIGDPRRRMSRAAMLPRPRPASHVQSSAKTGFGTAGRLPVQSTMNSFAPVRVEERWGSALSATW
jgi:hypothetical protein